MEPILLIIGAILLIFGRRLYWLFVAIIGFGAGALLAARFLGDQSPLMILAIGIGAGILGILLAVFLQKAAVGIAGFIAGAFILSEAITWIAVLPSLPDWIVFLIGGAAGAALAAFFFDWALVILSVISGAFLISQNLNFIGSLAITDMVSTGVFVVALLVGLIIQGRSLLKSRV